VRSTLRVMQTHQRGKDCLREVCPGISGLCIVPWLGVHSSESVQPAATFVPMLLYIYHAGVSPPHNTKCVW
jgi:hypothetical protein